MNKLLQAELWEIQGLLYIIVGKMVGGWLGNVLIVYGALSIVGFFIQGTIYRFKHKDDGGKDR